jgi:outer membrane lipoprotein-sorting protein
MRALIVFVLALAAPAYAQPAWAKLTPAEIAAKVEATYKDAASVTATFSKSVVNATFGTTTVTQGNVSFQRPGKMAWQFIDKKKQKDNEFLFDGTTGWMIQHKNKKVIQQQMSATDLPAVIAFLAGAGTLAKDFTIAAPKDKNQLVPGGAVIELSPKSPSASFKSVLLVIDPTAWTVVKSIVFSPTDEPTTYEFSSVNTKAKLDAKAFTFDAAKHPLYTIEKAPTANAKLPAPTKPATPAR